MQSEARRPTAQHQIAPCFGEDYIVAVSGGYPGAMLEVIDKGCSSESHPVPLLFVHGGWHGAWCWDEHFLDFFVDKGYRTVALSLRGHGNSPAGKRNYSIADLVADVGSVAETLPSRPVVIGHSMGGFIVQKYLESYAAPAGVLLATMPSRGIGGWLLRQWKRHPFQMVRATVTTKLSCTPKLARELFFSPEAPESDVVRYAARLGEENSGRLMLDMALLSLPKLNA